MKSYAIITDIHGNSPALKAVLEDIDSKEIEQIFCLGDMIGIGPDSNTVMELLLERNNISFVIGNHEIAVIAAFEGKSPPKGHEDERVHHKWLADRIEGRYIHFLKTLPKQMVYEDSGRKFYLAHYHLDSMGDYLPIEKNPTSEKLDELYSNLDYDIVCFGHHHIVHQFKSDKINYFNPGSLGCYHKPIARYGIVRINNNSIEEEVIEVPYNNVSFLKSYEDLKVPDREFILKIFHGAQI